MAELVTFPVVCMGVGPALRAILGDEYSLTYGVAVMFALAVLHNWLGGLWAQRHGGEWVTVRERRDRLIAEHNRSSRLQFVPVAFAACALNLTAVMLLIVPFQDIPGWLGVSVPVAFAAIALLSFAMAAPGLLASFGVPKFVVTEKLPRSRNFWSEQRRALPRLVIAYASGATAGVAFGSQFEGGTKFFAFLVTYMLVSAFLRYIVFRRQYCLSNDDGPVGINRYMWWGLTEFGILMAAGLSGSNFLETPHDPGYMAIQIGISVFVSALAGVAFGAFLYLFNRLAERHQPNPD